MSYHCEYNTGVSQCHWLLLCLLTIFLASCGIPLPVEYYDLAGEWQGEGISLSLNTDGRVRYWEKNGIVEKSIEAPLQEIDDHSLVIGVGSITAELLMDRHPWTEKGETWVKINGKELRMMQDYYNPKEGK